MAVLQKIRVKFGLAISIIIALALLSFIIDPSTLESALHSMSSKYDVGKIAGKSVSYTDFQEDVDKFTTIYQIASGSSVQNEQAQKQIRDAAWQDLVDKYMFVENAKDAGVVVGKAELNDLITGEKVSPIISGNPYFLNEKGEFSTDNVRTFVQNISNDQTGQYRTYWNYIQNTVLSQQFHVKYNAMFTNAAVLNKLQLADAISGNNNTFDVEYVCAPYPLEDTTIVVSDSEIKSYYKNHKEQYKQTSSRDIEYVVFEVVPSQADITKVNDEMNNLLDDFATTDNMKAFLLKNSEKSLSNNWYGDNELNFISKEVDDFVASAAKGVTSPIFKDGDVFRSVRVMDQAMIPDSAYVKHILLQGTDAKKVADSLVTVLGKGGNFSNLAALYSVDQNSNDGGELGNIGWLTQNYMIPGFESVITAETGKPFVLNTQYGTHVVLVSAKTKPVVKKQIAVLEKTTLASNETFNQYYAQANKFATITNGTYEGYKKALDSTKVYSHPMNGVTESTSSYGSVDQAKEITRWVFETKKGKASNIITINQNFFFIAALKNIHEEGYTPVQQLAGSIKNILFQQKLEEKIKAEVAEKIAGKSNLEEIANLFNTTVVKREGVSFNSASGIEPALAGAASVAADGKVCGPVAGGPGVYVFSVSNRQEGSFYTAEDANNFEAQKAMYSTQMILPEMMSNADVKDDRARFF